MVALIRRMGVNVALATLVFLVSLSLRSSSAMTMTEANQAFNEGNALYQQQNYAEAYHVYSGIVDERIRSADLYYNLANACARLGKTGEAVLYYERARSLTPRDNDIKFNLQKTQPAINQHKPFVLSVPFIWLKNIFSLREWMGAFLAMFLLWGVTHASALLISNRFTAKTMKAVAVIVGVAALVVGAFTATRYYDHYYVQHSVVMEPNTSVFSGPGEKFTPLSTLPEGAKIRRLNFNDSTWAHVTLPDGRRGFIQATKLQSI